MFRYVDTCVLKCSWFFFWPNFHLNRNLISLILMKRLILIIGTILTCRSTKTIYFSADATGVYGSSKRIYRKHNIFPVFSTDFIRFTRVFEKKNTKKTKLIVRLNYRISMKSKKYLQYVTCTVPYTNLPTL